MYNRHSKTLNWHLDSPVSRMITRVCAVPPAEVPRLFGAQGEIRWRGKQAKKHKETKKSLMKTT